MTICQSQVNYLQRLIKACLNEATNFRESNFPIFFTKRVVIKTLQDVAFLNVAAQSVIKNMLWFVVYHPIIAGKQQLQRCGDCLCIADYPLCDIKQTEKNPHRDWDRRCRRRAP